MGADSVMLEVLHRNVKTLPFGDREVRARSELSTAKLYSTTRRSDGTMGGRGAEWSGCFVVCKIESLELYLHIAYFVAEEKNCSNHDKQINN